jgi:hypothetical protein
MKSTPTTTTRERAVIDNKLIEKILRDSVDSKLTKLQIAKKRRCCFNTVDRILNKYEYGFWDKVPDPPKSPIRPNEKLITKERRKLSVPDRMNELSNDAIEIAELTLKRMKDLLNDPNQSISASQLTAFMNAASPYAIKKVEVGTKKKDDKAESTSTKYQIFKQQVS